MRRDQQGPWRPQFTTRNPKRDALPAPAAYVERLGSKSQRVDVWHTIYNHPMVSTDAVVAGSPMMMIFRLARASS